jgi:hypothetical protein
MCTSMASVDFYKNQKFYPVGVFSLRLVMGGAAYRGSSFCLGKRKQNRVFRKTRLQGGAFKSKAYPRCWQLNTFLLTQTVAQDDSEARSSILKKSFVQFALTSLPKLSNLRVESLSRLVNSNSVR